MLFSAHLVDSGVLHALRRKTPQANDVPGLLSARTAMAAPFSNSPLPLPQPKREVLLGCWEDGDAIDHFLATHKTGQAFAQGWHTKMELFRAVGVWPGLEIDMVAAGKLNPTPKTGPTLAVTIGTAYLKTAVPFLRVNNGLEKQFLKTPSGRWGTAMTNLPQRLVATLTIWDNAGSAVEYMRTGAHGDAIKNHYDPKKDPTGHTFVTGGGFFGFRALTSEGSLGGKNPIPAHVLTS